MKNLIMAGGSGPVWPHLGAAIKTEVDQLSFERARSAREQKGRGRGGEDGSF